MRHAGRGHGRDFAVAAIVGLVALSQRFRDQASDLTIQIASLLQGGVLSAAAFSLIAILQSHDQTAIRVILWLNFVIISLISFFQLCQRALFIAHAGMEVTLMLPLMALFQIIPFAIISTSGLGPDGWRYWYVADTQGFVESVAATLLTLGLTVWILAMPPNWPFATLFVSVHLALTLASGTLLVGRERRDAAALHAKTTL